MIVNNLNHRTEVWIKALTASVFCIGISVCLSWFIGVHQLTRLIDASSEMLFTTALLFSICAYANFCLLIGRKNGAAIAALIILSVSIITLIRYFSETKFQTISLFLENDAIKPYLDVMAMNTAVTFIFAAASIYLNSFYRSSAWSQALASVMSMLVLVLGTVSVVGYVADLSGAYQWAGLNPMALATGITFMVLGAALLLSSIRTSKAHAWHQVPWLAISLGVGLATVTGLIWSAFNAQYMAQSRNASDALLALGMSVSMLVAALVAQLRHVRLQAEQLTRVNAEISDLYENAPCGYHSLDKQGVFLKINRTELEWLGYSRDELIGLMPISKLLTADSLALF
ncbi:MAG: PAS domain S-box protein [Minisyncoccia bacterium]